MSDAPIRSMGTCGSLPQREGGAPTGARNTAIDTIDDLLPHLSISAGVVTGDEAQLCLGIMCFGTDSARAHHEAQAHGGHGTHPAIHGMTF